MEGFELDYDRRLENMIARRTAPVETMTKSVRYGQATIVENQYYKASPVFEVYNKLSKEGSAIRYTVGAMARIDPNYTKITYEQGDRVKNQLDRALRDINATCDFEYQGSVTNDTHIKSYSDIDLLAITQRFWTLEPPQQPSYPYEGNPHDDLLEIRSTSCDCLTAAFPKAEVDSSGAKSISISGGSLSRKIDIVPANWYNTNRYAQIQAKRFRAIQVLDLKLGERVKNMPFLHNYRIMKRNERTNGGLCKVIRLMKSLKYDSDSISLSSYDLAAIGYNMPEPQLMTLPGGEISLLARLKTYLDGLKANPSLCTEMLVPDESRKIFAAGHATRQELDNLRDEVDDLVEAVSHNLQKSFTKLAEARLTY
ncbi:MAG: hypothetical protein CME32_27965 [Gimesia sp.]|nr:hypothetical protein [Gimesia sp.]